MSGVNGETAVQRAEREIEEEKMAKAVTTLKSKLRERDAAQVVLDNLEREVEDLKQAIEQGNA